MMVRVYMMSRNELLRRGTNTLEVLVILATLSLVGLIVWRLAQG